MIQCQKGKIFNAIKEKRAQSIQHYKKDSIQKDNIIREYKLKKEPKISSSFLNLSDQKSFDNNPNPSQTPRTQLYCEPVSQRLEKTLSLFDNIKKFEQNLSPLKKQNQHLLINFGNQTSRYDSFRQIRIKENLTRNIHQKENDDNNSEYTHTHTSIMKLRKSNQFQKLLPIEKIQIEKNLNEKNQFDKLTKEKIQIEKIPIEKIPIEKIKIIDREDDIMSPLIYCYGTHKNQNNFIKENKETRKKSNSLFQRGNLSNRNEYQNNIQRKINQIQNNIENEDQQDSFHITNKKRSHSSQINDKSEQSITPQSNQKTHFMKQFTLKTINQKNQHLFIETQPSLNIKPPQFQNQYVQNTQQSLFQSEAQSFQSKVNVYMHNLKLLQNKNQTLHTTLSQINKPKQLPEQMSEFMKIGMNSTKTDKLIKKIDLQSKVNTVYNTHSNNSSPFNKNKNEQQKENSIDAIQICPFNQASNSQLQTPHEQAYNDDYDLCQYVQNNTKRS